MKRKRSWLAALLCAVLVLTGLPAAAAADAPSDWAQESVRAARQMGLVPEALDGDYTQPITRAEFCTLAAAVYRNWEAEGLAAAAPEAAGPFSDCDDPDVLLCAALGVVQGMGDGSFAPSQPLQRQQAASMLHRLGTLRTGEDGTTSTPHEFSDEADIAGWARADVAWVYDRGIMTGTGGNAFSPLHAYTREQSIATMLRLYTGQASQPETAQPEETVPEETAPEELPPEPAQPDEPSAPTPPYEVVVEFAGAGASSVYLMDANGMQLLTGFADTGGRFYNINLYHDWAGLQWQTDSGFSWAVCNLQTGQVLENQRLDPTDPAAASATAWSMGPDSWDAAYVLYPDGTYAPLS